MSPPSNGKGRLPGQGDGPDAQSATTTDRVTDHRLTAGSTELFRVVVADLAAAAYRRGRLAGFCDGWIQGLEARRERSWS